MHKKIDKYLAEIEYVGEYEDHEYGAEELTDRMIDFFMILDPDDLYDEQLDIYMNIMGHFDSYADMEDDEDEEMSEAQATVRVKRDREARRERRADYRKNKSKLKLKAKMWRKKPAYKKYQKKKKIMKSRGKTARGQRIRKFI